jgi:hypothetical protein
MLLALTLKLQRVLALTVRAALLPGRGRDIDDRAVLTLASLVDAT